jgi:hypothetical protein
MGFHSQAFCFCLAIHSFSLRSWFNLVMDYLTGSIQCQNPQGRAEAGMEIAFS